MNDKQIAALFMSELLPRMQAVADLASVKLKRNFQARQQGADSTAYAYFVKLFDHRYGHPQRKPVWNEQTQVFDYVEAEQYESTYQFSAWVPQTPSDINSLTESDILNIIAGIMQSDDLAAAFRAAGVGVLRVMEVRNPYVVDDRDQFEAVPSFDVVLTHTREAVSTLPAVVTYEASLGRV